ncbi:hypothetical protein BP6252_12673 [Coleophoma cylindrospora]|uniref:Xylanolytic transcriptional activator regulatory domain-containing protein n=1 Tax=Coleophoma cylindrospora TaxID=1849047 RepID=A0A3D8QCK8_9HELO|nr:hypothetical protein BP6252_12673 [Coleophoma cylindrospora]
MALLRPKAIEDLRTRVKRLEDMLAVKSIPKPLVRQDNAASSDTSLGEDRDDAELSKAVFRLETDAFDYKPSPEMAVTHYMTPNAQTPDSLGVSFQALISPSSAISLDLPFIVSTLPNRSQGHILINYYADHVNWIYHILHMPTIRRMNDLIYDALDQNQLPQHRHLALVSAVFGLSAYFGYSSPTFLFKGPDAKEYSYRWTSLAQAALSAANFINIPSLETIQAALLLAQHVLPNVGAIATFRTFAATAMHSARSLMIHQLDSPTNQRRRQNNPNVDWVDIELKRRLWWHIASTDWMLSFMSGPQCGSYMIHPKQMNVDYPANVDDEDIGSTPDYNKPMSVATEMTYFIFRNKTSEIFRDIVDAASDAGCELEDLPYDLVLEFDKRLHFLIHDAPAFFKFDTKSRMQSQDADRRRFISYQRNMGHFGLHTRLSRLHRPYLARGAHDPRYSYSRIVCLRSSRTVIELGSQMMAAGHNSEPLRVSSVWTVVHHIFVSTVILVMDFSYNRSDPQAAKRREEILDCFRLLERSQEDSTIARQGLKQLREFLNNRKWKKDHAAEPASPMATNVRVAQSVPSVDNSALYQPAQQSIVSTAPTEDPLAGYDFSNMDNSLLEYLNFDANLDSSEWETLFQNVEGSSNPLY